MRRLNVSQETQQVPVLSPAFKESSYHTSQPTLQVSKTRTVRKIEANVSLKEKGRRIWGEAVVEEGFLQRMGLTLWPHITDIGKPGVSTYIRNYLTWGLLHTYHMPRPQHWTEHAVRANLFLKINLFIYLYLAALGLCALAFSSCVKQGLLIVVCGLLTAGASLVEEHGL